MAFGASAREIWADEWVLRFASDGVALGNWLVLERWMDEVWDEWSWSQACGSQLKSVLSNHWNTWITDDDIRIIAASGFNHIRIPIGYWAFINQPAGTPYCSQCGQLDQLTRVLESANKYGLYAVIDLHGLPGSQNGEQESGHVGYNNWFQAGNQAYTDTTVDALISYINNSTYKHVISAVAACNEPVFYSEDQFDTLISYYERAYAKFQKMSPPMPMMFHPGHPEVNPFALFQSFINGKNPNYLIYEDHPYPGRLQPVQSQSSLLAQVCQKAQSYATYGVPVAVTEWAVSTAIWNNTTWDATFYAAQARAWAQSAGGIFWSYRTNAYTQQFNQTENFTLYSFIDLANNGIIPLPKASQTSQQYLFNLSSSCSFSSASDSYASTVPSIKPSVTAAFTASKRGLYIAEPTQVV
ncbi:hypothetical protein EMMF5_003052 [Cystobasidiomycetes sp. EMM_F5]